MSKVSWTKLVSDPVITCVIVYTLLVHVVCKLLCTSILHVHNYTSMKAILTLQLRAIAVHCEPKVATHIHVCTCTLR